MCCEVIKKNLYLRNWSHWFRDVVRGSPYRTHGAIMAMTLNTLSTIPTHIDQTVCTLYFVTPEIGIFRTICMIILCMIYYV
jgi:hypothetical protein